VKALKQLGMFIIAAAVGAGAYYLISQPGGINSVSQQLKPKKSVEVPAGTEVKLVLATPLESGGSKPGDEVKFLLIEDLKTAAGDVVAKQGTLVEGTVKESRAGSVMGTLTNRPARLVVSLEPLPALDGTLLNLEGLKPQEFEFTLSNTDIKNAAANLEALWRDPEKQEALKKLSQTLKAGKLPEGKELDQLADLLGLEDTKAAINGAQQGQAGLQETFRAIQQGNVAALGNVDLALALGAIGELEGLANGVDRTIRGMVKGRNIEALPGTTLELKTETDAKVTIRPAN
jgi:hypothetical protein